MFFFLLNVGSSHIQVDLELVDLDQWHASKRMLDSTPSLHFHRKTPLLGIKKAALALKQHFPALFPHTLTLASDRNISNFVNTVLQ